MSKRQKQQIENDKIKKPSTLDKKAIKLSLPNISSQQNQTIIKPSSITKPSQQSPLRYRHKSSSQLSSLKSYSSVPNLPKSLTNLQSPNKKTSLQNINISPKKTNRYVYDILTDGDFVKKNQLSVNSSMEDQNTHKLIDNHHTHKIIDKHTYKIMHKDKHFTTQNQHHHLQNSSLLNKNRMMQLVNLKLKDHSINNPRNTFYKGSTLLKPVIANSVFQTKPVTQKQSLVGPSAIQSFYFHYKNIQKVSQLQCLTNQANPLTIILTILQQYSIPPKRMDIIKSKGSQNILDLNSLSLGSGVSIRAISDILQKLNHFSTISLAKNNIHFDRVDYIIPRLKGLRNVDLSNNKIGRQGVQLLAKEVCVRDPTNDNTSQSSDDQQPVRLLSNLNLQQNSLTDTSLHPLLSQLKVFKHLKILNLSHNFLGNSFGYKLKQFLIEQNCLKQLYLHWNELTSKGIKLIFQALQKNYYLRVLDLSWNQIGTDAIFAMETFFKVNRSLLHLDISHCNILQSDTLFLAQALKSNHSLFGIHYQGNFGRIDSLGFLSSLQNKIGKIKYSLRKNLLQRIKGLQRIQSSIDSFQVFNHYNKTCWICDGWQEKTISIPRDTQNQSACFIHFDFQQYKGVLMDTKSDHYQILKMFPFRKVLFFVTKVTKNKQFVQTVVQPILYQDKFKTQNLYIRIASYYIESKQFKNVCLQKINTLESSYNYPQDLFDNKYNYEWSCLPRQGNSKPDPNIFMSSKKVMPKKRTTRDKSSDPIVRSLPSLPPYFTSTPKSHTFITSCIDYDISHSKLLKILSQPQDLYQIRQVLQRNYQLITNVFYYLCSSTVSINSIYYINQGRFQNFVELMKFQTKKLTKAKIKLKLITTLSINDQFSKDVDQRLFSRPQFIQFLLRIAIAKYCPIIKPRQSLNQIDQQPTSTSISSAFQRIILKLSQFQQTINLPQNFRQSYLCTAQITLTLKSYQSFISLIYTKYCGINQKNKNFRFSKMLLNQFKQIFIDSAIRKTKQSLKDAELAFIQAKQMEIQDGNKEFGLDEKQFIQALIRMAYINDFKPITTQSHHIWEHIQALNNYQQASIPKLKQEFQIPLFLKFQALLKKIYQQSRLNNNRRMDLIFSKGIFSQQVDMLIQLFKRRIQTFNQRQQIKPVNKKLPKIKLNNMQFLENNQIKKLLNKTENHQPRITLEMLISQLDLKYKKIAEQLDKKHKQLQQIDDEHQLQ